MRKYLTKFSGLFLLFLYPLTTFAQSADFLRSTGKIYSVVVVVLVIFIGIILFLIRLDRKITNLENEINNE